MKFSYKYSYRKTDAIRPHIFWLPKNTSGQIARAIQYCTLIDSVTVWCAENLRAKSHLYPRAKGWIYNPYRLRVEIASEDDAFAFKMRWC